MKDTLAISRYLAAHLKFMPEDHMEGYYCDKITEQFYALYTSKILPHNFEFNKTKQLKLRKELLEEHLPKFLTSIEDMLSYNFYLAGS